ncbi:MAG: hypothetical protein M3220_17880 [Chloroflexota bacterium]|nr:hypothetical protein [Chloroflexota bacterium]
MSTLSRFGVLIVLMSALLLSASGTSATSGTLSQDASYQLCGRIFSDPHAYWPALEQLPERSPYAKGNATCASTDFVTYEGMIEGMSYLESLFPQFIEFQRLEEDFGANVDCALSTSSEDLCSAGLPQQGTTAERVKSDLYMVRVTDERVPDDDKRFFVFPLAVHGIERAGAEAGVRAAEDLATWAACEAGVAPDIVNCAQEGAIPHPLLETDPQNSLMAGEVLQRSAIYFIFPNPDGWRRGDPDNLARFYQRYNGNGVDLNRDWPTIGFTFRPYTPWSEPESRGFGKVLKQIRPQWDGGIDLHGQLIDRAFSFTLLGASQRDYGKNQRILQTVKGAWGDAEARFAWADAYIKPNDAPEDDPRMYGVQWGTVWDTIGYQVTGSLGDWIDSPLGLGGDGIDNEMSLSHLSNCGTGSCYLPDFEQLHIDGNKSLIYSMVNFTLLPEDTTFRAPGQVGYVYNPRVLENAGDTSSVPGWVKKSYPQDAIQATLDITNNFTYEFEIRGRTKNDKVYNGGVEAKITFPNLGGISVGSITSLVLERNVAKDQGHKDLIEGSGCGDGDHWEEVNRYYNQSSVYLQAGQAVHANSPEPGLWRVCLTGGLAEQLAATGGSAELEITFSGEKAWEDPGQRPYSVTNMKFFDDLQRYMEPGQLVAVNVDDVLQGKVDLSQFTSLIIADDPLPGYVEPIPTGEAQTQGERDSAPTEAALTVPCAWPSDINSAPATCVADYEFDVLPEFNNQQLLVTLDSPDSLENDWDLYLQRQSQLTGEWFTVASSTTPTGDEQVNTQAPPDGHYRVRVLNWAGTQPPERLAIDFSNEYPGPSLPPSERTEAERDQWAATLRGYVEGGGNLVLTDGALRNLAYMDVVDRSAVNNFTVYAGFIGFTRDGQTDTYSHPSGLAKDVNQPGAAEGEAFRHQSYEPVPLGFAIQNENGADFNASPVWAIDRDAWESQAGVEGTVGVTTPDQVTLGELKLGNGRVRIIGALLPMPSEQYYHPFGLSNYALTYTGYQVLNNALQIAPQ